MFMEKPKPKVHPLALTGVAVLFGGSVAWMWSGEWRWAATGLLASLMLFAVATEAKMSKSKIRSVSLVGWFALCLGLTTWAWLGEWRWAATGALVACLLWDIAGRFVIANRRPK